MLLLYLFNSLFNLHAERGGFEPPIRFWRIHAFQACLFNHSSTSPIPGNISCHKCILFFLLLKHYHFFILNKSFKLIYFKTLKFIFGNSKHFQSILTCSFRNEIIFFIVYLTQFSYHLAHIGTFISFTPIRHRS